MLKKAYYLVKIENSPKHIKYRYSATLQDNNIKEIALECVTEIEGEHVPFKEIFRLANEEFDNAHSTIKEHIDLFTQILQIKPKSLVLV